MGFIVRSIATASQLRIKLYIASAWTEGFDPSKYVFPTGNPPAQDQVEFIQVAVTPFNTEKFRVYEQSSKGPRLVNRFDRDLYWDEGIYHLTTNPWPDREKIDLVIVTDFSKGLLNIPKVVQILKEEYEGKPFFLDAKREATHPVFMRLPWTLALPNREEFARLVGHDPVEVPSFRESNGTVLLNPMLAEGVRQFSQKFAPTNERPERSVLIKLDREGALLFENRFSAQSKLTALLLSSDETKSTGIGAGDVAVSRLAIERVQQQTADYPAACEAAVISATAFCKTGNIVSHEDRSNPGWYGIDVDVTPAVIDKTKSRLKKMKLDSLSAFCDVIVARADQESRSLQALTGANPVISIKQAKWFLEGFLTVDRELGSEILRLRSQFRRYLEAKDPAAKPFVVALCGTPGSGKSALADALPKAFECDVIKANAAQWTSIEDLFRLCEEIRTVRVKGGKPFVFIDEVDTDVAREKLYGKLLAPLGDGAYSSFGYVRQLGAAAFLLAGSNEPWGTTADLTGSIVENEHPKLRDLVSRFSIPPVQVPALKDRRMDALYLAAYLLYEQFPGLEEVEKGVLTLLSQSAPEHGPRSIKEIVKMFGPLKDSRYVTTGDLNKTAQYALGLHLKNPPSNWEKETTKVRIVP